MRLLLLLALIIAVPALAADDTTSAATTSVEVNFGTDELGSFFKRGKLHQISGTALYCGVGRIKEVRVDLSTLTSTVVSVSNSNAETFWLVGVQCVMVGQDRQVIENTLASFTGSSWEEWKESSGMTCTYQQAVETPRGPQPKLECGF